MISWRQISLFGAILALTIVASCKTRSQTRLLNENRTRLTDESQALWSYYRFSFIDQGRVVSHDEGKITTSEGQSYAMLRAVWSNDREAFNQIWEWTKRNLQVRSDKLFAWKWKDRVLDENSATDADVDIALALILASRRFDDQRYLEEAAGLIKAIRQVDIAKAGVRYIPTAGNWTRHDRYIQVHLGYLAPYAYAEFASVDKDFPWKDLVNTSYSILNWVYFDQKLALPPEYIFVDRSTGKFLLKNPATGAQANFGYDVLPLFWRIAVDQNWFRRGENQLRSQMLKFFSGEFAKSKQIFERYTLNGKPLSNLENQPLYATIASLARTVDTKFADEIYQAKLSKMWGRGPQGRNASLLPA